MLRASVPEKIIEKIEIGNRCRKRKKIDAASVLEKNYRNRVIGAEKRKKNRSCERRCWEKKS